MILKHIESGTFARAGAAADDEQFHWIYLGVEVASVSECLLIQTLVNVRYVSSYGCN